MNNYYSNGRQKSIKLAISLSTIVSLLILIIFNLPSFITELNVVYHAENSFGNNNWAKFSYDLTGLDILVCFIGILLYRRKTICVKFLPIILLVLLKDFVLFLAGKETPFTTYTWEMYFGVCVAYFACRIVCYYTKNSEDINRFLSIYVFMNFIYQILFFMTGRVKSNGSVSVMNQDSGAVGFTCALYILFTLIVSEKKNYYLLGICFLSIILSGSRYSLLIVLLGIIVFGNYIFSSMDRKRRHVTIATLVILFSFALYIFTNSEVQQHIVISSKFYNLFSGNIITNISEDQSMLERIQSFRSGFEILAENPFGISNSFTDLQQQTINHGFFAFPHSYFLSYYLLWGPAFLLILIWIIKCIRRAHILRNIGIKYFMIFIFISFSIYGGPTIGGKTYLFIFALFSLINSYLESTIINVGGN